MKAWNVFDKNRYAEYSIIVFAETKGKAVSLAIGTDEFPKCDWDFTELRARREPDLDDAYRGSWRMEWNNDADRLAMVRIGYHCGDDAFDPDDCEHCVAKDECSMYAEYREEENDYDPCYECRGLGDDYIINDDGELESWCDKCGVNPDRMKDDE